MILSPALARKFAVDLKTKLANSVEWPAYVRQMALSSLLVVPQKVRVKLQMPPLKQPAGGGSLEVERGGVILRDVLTILSAFADEIVRAIIMAEFQNLRWR